MVSGSPIFPQKVVRRVDADQNYFAGVKYLFLFLSHHVLGPRESYKLSNLTIIFSVICRRIDRRLSP